MGHFWLEFDIQGHRQRYDFQQASVSIGRDAASDFHLDHTTVSRQHAMIVENYGNYQLVVLSRNGLTAIDGQVVTGTVDLRPGMTIQVGEVQLGFRSAIGNGGVGEVATESLNLSDVNGHAPTGMLQSVDERTEPSRDAWVAPQAPAMQQQQQRPPQQQGFGQMAIQPAQGFDAAPAPPSGFGQMAINPGPAPQNGVNGGFNGVPAQGGAPRPAKKNEDEFKIKSWEEIAAEGATGAHDAVGGVTDFERIQKAQAKAQKKGAGTNPVMLGVLALAVVGMAALFLLPEPAPPPPPGEQTPERCANLQICYPMDAEPTCANKSDCEAKAQQAYNVADELSKKKDANITNRYEAYKQLDKAGRYMAKADILDNPPEAMKDYGARLLEYEQELEDIARDHRIRHHQLQQRNMNWDMATNVRSWQAYFPDSYNTWFREAIEAERRMKDSGSWPKTFDPKPAKKKRGR